jgi:DNA-directed RNA polymerase specialized sigma24 family protein
MATDERDKAVKMRHAEAVYREVVPMVLTMARNKGRSVAEQWEVVQEVGAVIVTKIDEYDPAKGSARMWGAGIARRVLLETSRAGRTERRIVPPGRSIKHMAAPDATPEQTARAREALDLIHAAVREDCRLVFDLDAQGYTAPEISGVTGLPETAVVWKLRQAREDLKRAIARMAGDDKDPTPLRGAILPFASVEEVSRALRIPELSKERFAELWRDVLDRVEERSPAGDDAAQAPPKTPDPPKAAASMRAPSVLDGFTVPIARGLSHVGPRVALSAAQLATAGLVLLAAGGALGIAATMLHGRTEAPPTLVTERPRLVALDSAEGSTPAELDGNGAERAAGAPPRPSVRSPLRAPARTADPATMDEGPLLHAALFAPPARALALARLHAQRFPSRQVQKREAIIAQALAALGREHEAEEHANGLPRGAYEPASRSEPAND